MYIVLVVQIHNHNVPHTYVERIDDFLRIAGAAPAGSRHRHASDAPPDGRRECRVYVGTCCIGYVRIARPHPNRHRRGLLLFLFL